MSLLPYFDFPHSHPFVLMLSPLQGLPPVLPPLPKRPALEKANGATTMFNAGVFPYQQALANMQFQQQAAFIPSGKVRVFFNWCLFCGSYPIHIPHSFDYGLVSALSGWMKWWGKNLHSVICTYMYCMVITLVSQVGREMVKRFIFFHL